MAKSARKAGAFFCYMKVKDKNTDYWIVMAPFLSS